MCKVVIIALFLIPLLFAHNPKLKQAWSEWKQTYGKVYANEMEEIYRLDIFSKNLHYIEKHNRGNHTFTLAMNQFGDQTAKEFAAKMNHVEYDATTTIRNTTGIKIHSHDPKVTLPASIDWRSYGAVSFVKNQGSCGACYSFSATGALEGAWALSGNGLPNLSEQQIIDCSGGYGNIGCAGGLPDLAFEYLIAFGGSQTAASYNYEGAQGPCRSSSGQLGAYITSYVDVQSQNEAALQNAIAYNGPISIAIDASHSSFQFYSTGVYYEPACSPTALDHGVLVVGYGTTSGYQYYIVKNSWGTAWGEAGYILMTRNNNNNCGIATLAAYPIA